MKTMLAALTAVLTVCAAGAAPVRVETFAYSAGDLKMIGWLAGPPEGGPRPAVLVVHEWMGLNDYAKQRARQLAESGYVALAVDMYGGGKIAGDTAEAQALSGALKQDRPELRRRIRAAMDALKKDPRVNTNLVAAIGYCFGGTTVLELARSGADLRCVVSFHGALDTPLPAAPGGLRASVLVCHGADDPFVPAKEVEAFEQEMRAARADWQLVVYGGAVHSFTNPGAGDDPAKGAAYNEPAERRSWQAMRTFLREKLGPVE